MIYENETRIKEFNSFKNEILKLVNTMESKLMEQINIKSIEFLSKITHFEDKIKNFENDNSSMKTLFTDQKVKIEQIFDYERIQKKLESIVFTHDLRLNGAIKDINNLKVKYDKIMSEHLSVAGFIGPSCQYKTIGDYLSHNIKNISKFKSEKEQMTTEIINLKQKIEIMYKNLMTLIDAGVNRSNNYTNNKTESFNQLINSKYEDISSKIMDMKMRDIQTKIENEKLVNEIKQYFDEIKEMKIKIENEINEDKNSKIRNKKKDNSFIKNHKSYSSEKNVLKGLNKLESRKQHQTFKTKTYRKQKKIEKEGFREKYDEKEKEKETNIENNPENENEIKKNKEGDIIEEKIIEEEKVSNKNIINLDIYNNINSLKKNLLQYENELKDIKKNIKDINSKIKLYYLTAKPKKCNKTIDPTNTESNDIIERVESKTLQTSLENCNAHTQENFYQKSAINENESDENTRNVMYEKLYRNILINHNKNKYKKIDINNNVKFKYYDLTFHDKKKESLTNKRFYSPKNTKNKTIYCLKFKNNLINKLNSTDNSDRDISKNAKDLFLLKFNKIKILKDKTFIGLKESLEKSIMKSIKNLIKDNNNKKDSLQKNNNMSFTPKDTEIINLSYNNNKMLYQNVMSQTTGIDNNNISTQKTNDSKINNNIINLENNKHIKPLNCFRNTNLDKNIENKKRNFLSPIVDKLYKDYYNKNSKKEDSLNSKYMPKKIIPVFGRTTYVPIKEIKKSFSDKPRIRININKNKK